MAKVILNKVGEIQEDGSVIVPSPYEIDIDPTFIYAIQQSNPNQLTIIGGVDLQNPSFSLTVNRMISGAKPPNEDERQDGLGPTWAGLLSENTFEIVVEKQLEPGYVLGGGNDEFLKNQSQAALELAVASAKTNGIAVFEEVLWTYTPTQFEGYEICRADLGARVDKATAEWMAGYTAWKESGSTDTLRRGPVGGVIDVDGLDEGDLQQKIEGLISTALAPVGGCGEDPIKRRILNYTDAE